jgi:Leucine-rich repeat (LRR) protein
LVLRDNNLIELPEEIENLKQLKELHIQSNRIQLLPKTIGLQLNYRIRIQLKIF